MLEIIDIGYSCAQSASNFLIRKAFNQQPTKHIDIRWIRHGQESLFYFQSYLYIKIIHTVILHLANLCATMANRGYYYIPHLIRGTDEVSIDPKYYRKQYTLVDTAYFPVMVEGMYRAVNSGYSSGGTATVAAVDGLDICGKTGTAQNPLGDDNSVFICFAPKDDPKIAVAAYVEHGSFGARWAAPIASLLVEKYLNGEISESRRPLETRVLEGNLLDKVNTR